MKCLSWMWYALVVAIALYMFILLMGIIGVAVGSYDAECVKVLKWTVNAVAQIVG